MRGVRCGDGATRCGAALGDARRSVLRRRAGKESIAARTRRGRRRCFRQRPSCGGRKPAPIAETRKLRIGRTTHGGSARGQTRVRSGVPTRHRATTSRCPYAVLQWGGRGSCKKRPRWRVGLRRIFLQPAGSRIGQESAPTSRALTTGRGSVMVQRFGDDEGSNPPWAVSAVRPRADGGCSSQFPAPAPRA
jgi:hypothetical protein